jgi:glucose dehydrogenase
MRFSPLHQIMGENVSRLRVVWTAHTGDVSETTLPGCQDRKRSAFENTPILVDGALYVTTQPKRRTRCLACFR